MLHSVPRLIEVLVLLAYACLLMMLFGLALYCWVFAMATESATLAAWMVATGGAFVFGRWSLFRWIITDAS